MTESIKEFRKIPQEYEQNTSSDRENPITITLKDVKRVTKSKTIF